MSRKSFFVLVIVAVALFTSTVSAQKPRLLTFDQLGSYDSLNQTFRIFGYVYEVYKCPPCPPHAMCKPCVPDSVTIIDKAHRDPVSHHWMGIRVLTDQTDKFVRGERYLFTVKVHGNLAEGKPITDVDLIKFETLPLGDPLM